MNDLFYTSMLEWVDRGVREAPVKKRVSSSLTRGTMKLSFKEICQNSVVRSGEGSVKDLAKEIGISGVRRLLDMSCIVVDPNTFTWKMTDKGKEWIDVFDKNSINKEVRKKHIEETMKMMFNDIQQQGVT